MHPYLFTIGRFRLATYGVLVALGYLAALFYARTNARRIAFDEEQFWDMFAALIIGAVMGGKILYAVLFWHGFGDSFFGRLWGVLRDFRSGFVYLGGLAGAISVGYWYLRKNAIEFFSTADMLAPAIALGHAIGRIGCFMAGCCYGLPTSGRFGVVFNDPDCLVPSYYLGVPLHPVQLYESVCNLLLFLALHRMFLAREKFRKGAVFMAYACGYALVRFSLEFLRGDERGGFFLWLSPSQWGAVAMLIVCVLYHDKLPQRSTENAGKKI
jgi:phosphatidylglycerol:prolipoprotein diacylglycerol transferase